MFVQVSTENGAIVSNSARWPLIIDPQLQARSCKYITLLLCTTTTTYTIGRRLLACRKRYYPTSALQGIKWIRTKESLKERNLEVVRLGQPDILRKLEKALENGYDNVASFDILCFKGMAYCCQLFRAYERHDLSSSPVACSKTFYLDRELRRNSRGCVDSGNPACSHLSWSQDVHQIGRLGSGVSSRFQVSLREIELVTLDAS